MSDRAESIRKPRVGGVGKGWTLAALIVTMVIGALLRLWGLRWGMPNSLHDFTYHPDEVFQVGAMLRIFSAGLDPGFYSYPSGYLNLGAGVLKVAVGYGLSMDGLTGPYMVARAVTAACGILTIPVVYGIGNRLYGRTAGLLGALIMAIIPLHMVHSHFATVDVPATMWVAAALLCAAIIYKQPKLSIYIAAGTAVGFATGTKYNTVLILIPVVVAHFLREDEGKFAGRLKDGKLWFALFACAIAFFVSTPGWLIWPEKFAGGLQYEFRHAATGHGLIFVDRGPGWFDVLTNGLGYGMGVFLLVLSLCAVGYAIVRHSRADWILLSFLIPYFLMVSFSEVRFARYAIPTLPVLAVLVARMAVGVLNVLEEQRAVFLRWVWVGICACLIGYTAVYALAFDRLFSQSDPRERTVRWFREHVKPGAMVGLPTVPWFYSPPFARGIIGTPGRGRRYEMMSQSPYRLIANPEQEWDSSVIAREKPEYVVMSDYEYEDPQRLKLGDYERFRRELNRSYEEVAVFRKDFTAVGIDFGSTEYLPHDLKYMSPTIRVYRISKQRSSIVGTRNRWMYRR